MKIDIGCGSQKKEGFIGVDSIAFPGVDIVADITQPWTFAEDGSVDEIHCCHLIEHLTALERVHLYNEIHRVLTPTGTAFIQTPHWGTCRAYGDPTHVWPPVSEFSFYYLDRNWRLKNAPHTDKANWPDGYDCHLNCTWGYAMHDTLLSRNAEYQQFAVQWYKESVQDIMVTVRKAPTA